MNGEEIFPCLLLVVVVGGGGEGYAVKEDIDANKNEGELRSSESKTDKH